MGLLRWLTKNWAETVTPSHSDLMPMRIDRAKYASSGGLPKLLEAAKNWKVEATAADGSVLSDRVKPLVKSATFSAHLTRKTGTVRFIDDIWVWMDEAAEIPLLQIYSASRLGKGDLGQNRRNILELQKLLQNLAKV